MERIILTTGGTGGHIFPALAVAEALQARYPHIRLLFVGSTYGLEKKLAEQAGVEFVGLPVQGFVGRGVKALTALFGMVRALIQAIGIVRRYKPTMVVGFGGYAAFAPVLAARLCGVPTAVHEQNAVAGVSNRLLGRFVDIICVSLENTRGFEQKKCVVTGNPVRRSVLHYAHVAKNFTHKHLLIMGGSQGAHALNRMIENGLPRLYAAGVQLRHQTGTKDAARVAHAYEAAGYDRHSVSPFIDTIAEAYAWADLVLCRSGASSVAELAVAGLPSVLVPFPHATHDHQTMNARFLADKGAAILMPESQCNNAGSSELLIQLLEDPQKLGIMAAAAKKVAQPHAAETLVNTLHNWLIKA